MLIEQVVAFCRSAENRKEEGNQLYKAKKYLEALAKYSAAIELCPENPAFYGNRSACHMMLSQYNKVWYFVTKIVLTYCEKKLL